MPSSPVMYSVKVILFKTFYFGDFCHILYVRRISFKTKLKEIAVKKICLR